MVCQSAEGGDEFDAFVRFVVAEDFDDAVGRASQKKGRVVFVDEARFVDPAARRIAVGEAAEASVICPIPYATRNRQYSTSISSGGAFQA